MEVVGDALLKNFFVRSYFLILKKSDKVKVFS